MSLLERKYWEGKYFDLWLFVHFFTGVLWGFLPFFLNISFFQALLIFAVLAIAWEIIEAVKKVKETLENRVIDVLFGVSGVVATYLILPAITSNTNSQLIIFIIVSVFTLVLSFLSWFVFSRYARQ